MLKFWRKKITFKTARPWFFSLSRIQNNKESFLTSTFPLFLVCSVKWLSISTLKWVLWKDYWSLLSNKPFVLSHWESLGKREILTSKVLVFRTKSVCWALQLARERNDHLNLSFVRPWNVKIFMAACRQCGQWSCLAFRIRALSGI